MKTRKNAGRNSITLFKGKWSDRLKRAAIQFYKGNEGYLLLGFNLFIIFFVGFRYGLRWVIVCYGVFALFIVWKMWDHIKIYQDHIACMIWGKPLRKEFWGKGERPAWPKLVLKKKKHEHSNKTKRSKKH